MKIRSVTLNNRKRAFEIRTWREKLLFPYSKVDPRPTPANPVVDARIDEELGREGFSYKLASGGEGFVHIDQALEYNQDPSYMRDLLLYRLTIEAQNRMECSGLSKREVIRRLGTSPAQFYRLLDSTNYRKSIDKLLLLLQILDCEIDFVVRAKSA
jgi:hypothetical protein